MLTSAVLLVAKSFGRDLFDVMSSNRASIVASAQPHTGEWRLAGEGQAGGKEHVQTFILGSIQ